MSFRNLVLIATLGSAAVLLGAYGFQHLGGLAPCKMCLWQRWPHGAAVLIGIAALVLPFALLPFIGAAAALATGAIGVFHTGVEKGWWEGITSCAGAGDLTKFEVGDLLNPNVEAGPPLVKCDEVAFEFLTLSMASWNAVFSLILVILWIMAARKPA